jgi:hypothetical protein
MKRRTATTGTSEMHTCCVQTDRTDAAGIHVNADDSNVWSLVTDIMLTRRRTAISR